MKKILLQLSVFLVPLFVPFAAFPQQNGWTEQQQEEFRQQMDQFKAQLQQQMDQLRDSLSHMQQHLKQQDWSAFDSAKWDSYYYSDMPPMPDSLVIPVPPQISIMEVNPGDDSTEVRIGKWKMSVEENYDGNDKVRVYKDEDCDDEEHESLKNVNTKFLLMDIGLNNYFAEGLSSNFPTPYKALVPNPGKSWVVDLHIFNQRVNLIDHHLWLSYGVFFEFNSYKYNSQEVMQPRLDSVAFQENEEALKKNKLSCEYVGIPLMLRYETNPRDEDKSFHIAAGGFGEYLLGAHTKIKNTSNDKAKQHDDFNLNRFRYGVTARVGYAWINLFVNYSLSTLFEKDIEPDLKPVSAGLAFEF
jgi:hypothetical protein